MDGDERRRALPELSEQWVATTDGRQLRAVVAGTGTDLVVLETGLGAAALTWGPVMEHLAPHCRVVAYDRAGYGRSDPGPGPRDLSRLADDLLAVVGAVDHSRLVLAGHSWGGPLARLAAARLMEEATGSLRDGPDARHGAARRSLTGLVLVAAADEHAELYFSRAMRVQRALQGPMLQVLALRTAAAPPSRTGCRPSRALPFLRRGRRLHPHRGAHDGRGERPRDPGPALPASGSPRSGGGAPDRRVRMLGRRRGPFRARAAHPGPFGQRRRSSRWSPRPGVALGSSGALHRAGPGRGRDPRPARLRNTLAPCLLRTSVCAPRCRPCPPTSPGSRPPTTAWSATRPPPTSRPSRRPPRCATPWSRHSRTRTAIPICPPMSCAPPSARSTTWSPPRSPCPPARSRSPGTWCGHWSTPGTR